MQRLRSVTSTLADSHISKDDYRNKLHPSFVARIAQGPFPNDPGTLPPLN